jgi:Bacterial aa3 type cytochrome c oxidase subunit IV
MAGQASEYHHGEMDVHAQQQTFHAVMIGTKWASLAIAVGVVFLTLWFCTSAGFGTAFISAVILLVVGIFALRQRGTPAH